MLSEEMILHYVPRIFKGYHVKAKTLIRITRNADIDADSMYDEDLDYRDFMVELIKKRKKLAPVRMELSREMDGEIIDLLCEYLELERKYVFYTQTPLDLSFVFKIQDILRRETDLFFEKRVPQRSPQFNEEMPIMDQIEKEDKLLSYPYESMRPFLKMLQEAAEDKDVVSIKMTLYRVAKQSKIIASLIEAAENGKDVTILVELKARFDEENNIEWSRQLEDAGCRVIYGLDGYKVHSKLCLITRKKKGKVSYITQIGTGNYNEKTSKLYTDLSLPYSMRKFLDISQLLQEIREWKSLFYCCTMFFVRSCTWSRSHLICSACWSSIAFWLLMTPINTSGLLLMLTVELLM